MKLLISSGFSTGQQRHWVQWSQKIKFFQCRNQWYQPIGYRQRMKNYKETYDKSSLHPQLSVLNPIMHAIFKVAFEHWGVSLLSLTLKQQTLQNLNFAGIVKYIRNSCFTQIPVKLVCFFADISNCFPIDENRLVAFLKRP